MSTYYDIRPATGSGHSLDGRLRGYCQGIVPLVLRVTGYGPTTWIRPAPLAIKQLGNDTPRTRDGPTTPD
jgi:hypothetical protein